MAPNIGNWPMKPAVRWLPGTNPEFGRSHEFDMQGLCNDGLMLGPDVE